MINPDNSSYIAMHLDRLSDELLSGTYGKREELQKEKQKVESSIKINNSDIEKIKLRLKTRF
jgi:peptidoglycan hydrolase CwlO-like protein